MDQNVPLVTERASPRYSKIDAWLPADILEAMVEAQFAAVAAVHGARSAIEAAAVAAEGRLRKQGRLIYAGAGTSGRLAIQDGAELAPTFGWPQDRLVLLLAGGDEALMKSVEGAEDQVHYASDLFEEHAVVADDVLIAVAASGTTPFTLECLRIAKRRGTLTIGIANNPGTPILIEADHAIWLDTGHEPIAGSTRLKAGTAQKITLNTLSSLLMILLGKVHDGLMIDMVIVNQKLARRGERILVQLSGRSGADVREALSKAGGNIKVAALLLQGCDLGSAKQMLEQAGGHLRAALTLLK
jgi:N-acetylmuramic acid 6-phosphate etherase